eukprot:TRINITY_DN55488_c0_g1_i1.p1 TRINITY_DN55488_c0_g1~~TRINITY_DN55488_c0_g1_i1.p1  ORF type:complete len:484 (-),score=63.75 TRINITY_DN55488_c0_g1_i1:47-1465(-)
MIVLAAGVITSTAVTFRSIALGSIVAFAAAVAVALRRLRLRQSHGTKGPEQLLQELPSARADSIVDARCTFETQTTDVQHIAVHLFERLGRPRWILAPMVDQSELPFRLLARRYGAQLCYTPMVNSGQFVRSATYRREVLADFSLEDRPLIVQFAGHDPGTLLEAAKHVEHLCDAVDLNLGCPQGIARRGRYGSYLLEEEDLVVDIVQTLSTRLRVPVTCKIRLFRGDLPRTLRLCCRLEGAGCALLTVHGRTRFQNKQTVGACDFPAIAAVKAALRIPVVANGGVAVFEDLHRILQVTGADGVMSSEAALENPALFCNNRDAEGVLVDQNRLAHEYLDLCQKHLLTGKSSATNCPKCVKAHLFKLLFAGIQAHTDLRDRLACARSLDEYRSVASELEARGWAQPMFGSAKLYRYEQSWYFRHRLAPPFDFNEAVVAEGEDSKGRGKKQMPIEAENDANTTVDAPWNMCLFD